MIYYGTVSNQVNKLSQIRYFVDNNGDRIYLFLKLKTKKTILTSNKYFL